MMTNQLNSHKITKFMKKEYMKPKVAAVCVTAESMLATSDNRENMGSNETPGDDDAFNAGASRGEWGNLWKNNK
jgi:hypothetical protein